MMAMLQCCLLVFLLVGCQIHAAESAVTFPTAPFTASVPENATVNAAVVTVAATDGGNDNFVFTLETQDPDTTPKVFSIHPTSGAITVSDATTLDYETTKGYSLVIKATQSGGGTPLSATTTVTVTVADVNEAPTFAKDMYTACVNKSSPEETVVVQVTASDEDDGDTITYLITAGDDNSMFTFGSPDGTIKVAAGKTVGDTPVSYNLTITATDDDATTPKTGTTTVSINVADPCPGVTPAPNFSATTTASFCLFLISVLVHLLHIW